MAIRAVFFDIGETLIDETRSWSALAVALGIPPFTLIGVLGGLISERRDHREVFDILCPDLGWDGVVAVLDKQVDCGFAREDLYPDVVPCLRRLKSGGYFVGIAGNQPVEREGALHAMELPVDFIATSGGWGIKKPAPAFFQKIVAVAGCEAHEVVYVGDRVDNDVLPAADAGMVPIHLVRGPWGYLQRDWPGIGRAKAQLKTLSALSLLLERR
jgi:HAD superfamily hydrolase (TIGR01549 family)